MSKYEQNSLFAEDKTDKVPAGRIIRVAFESGVDAEFDYLVPDKLWPIAVGQRIEAPFGKSNKLEIGFCVEINAISAQPAKGKKIKLKAISAVIDKEPLVDAGLMELARWISDYYVCPLGMVLGAIVPGAVKKGAGEKKQKYVYLAVAPEQIDKIADQIKGKKQKQVVQQLRDANAFEIESAIELDELLEAVGCTDVPVKNLVEKGIIKISQRTVLKSLPAMPEGMLIKHEKVVLNDDQQKALANIISRINEDNPPNERRASFGVTLLFGVTDSGKTELYIKTIEQTIKKGKTAIVMLPEIALTTQTIQRFSARFDRIAVMHSGLTAPQRNTQWHKIKSGEADVVIGARSAVFAPLANLGLIVVDEEHEPSYKQDTTPRYHGRDVAIKRAQLCNAHCVLGSATPSLETLQNCKTKRAFFNMVRLPKRVMNLPFPEMRLVDMKDFASQLMSEPLVNQLTETLARKEQAILLLNRRGYSSFIFCPSCKHILRCRNCDVTLTFHKTPDRQISPIPTITGRHMHSGCAICHYCGSQTLVPEKCPLCRKGLTMIGLGSQRLEEDLAKKFPNAKIARVDSDSMKGADYYRVLRDFSEGKINILAGTQILAKGLHFPNVTLVGIISADTSLYLPDFRANERTFQLISQVAGRAGRSAKKGIVFIQTFLTNQPAIQFALKNDFEGFVKEELTHRSACNLPPFWRLALITLRDRTHEKLELAAKLMREKIDRIVADEKLQIRVRGPIQAIISRIQTFHRMQIIIQAPQPAILHRLFTTLRNSPPVRPAVTIAIDVDPVDLL
jgi:primosomal protein N' (replication factor Y)